VQRLLRSAGSQTEWIQLAHLNAYEIAWCEAFQHDWEAARLQFKRLQDENTWSKAFYAYMQAVALLQLGAVRDARAKMREVVALSNRKLGGRVISAEQWAVRRRGVPGTDCRRRCIKRGGWQRRCVALAIGSGCGWSLRAGHAA
jgi:hypothetical protein